MEEIIFSSVESEERLTKVQTLLDSTTVRLYRKYDYLHDVYIRDIQWSLDERGRSACVIHLFQDIVQPPCALDVRMDNILSWNHDYRLVPYRQAEIYYFYLSPCPEGLQVQCSTDGNLEFQIVVKKVRIRRHKD